MKSIMCVLFLACFALVAEGYMGFQSAKDLMFRDQHQFKRQMEEGDIDPNSVGPICSKSLLQWAAEGGLDVAANALMNYGANVNFRDRRSNKTPLAIAAGKGFIGIANALIGRGGHM